MSVMREIFAAENKQNNRDGASTLAMMEVFFCLLEGMQCKKAGCDGKPILKPLKEEKMGKNHFVGCSGWRSGESFQHLYAPIPEAVDETILFQFINKKPIDSKELAWYSGPCSAFHHPRHGRQKKCMHTHFRDGLPYSADMIDYPCKVKKIVYTTLDKSRPIFIVMFEGRHTHPPWPAEKLTQDVKTDIEKCLNAFGILGATAEKLDSASSTIALLGMPLSAKHASLRNKRVLHDAVYTGREKASTGGLQWSGIIEQYERDLKTLKPEEQYIWHLRMEGPIKLVVTAHPVLAKLIHESRFLVCDYTFKRLDSDMNEWEVTIWRAATNERVTVSRVYCNSATHEAFEFVWEGFFKAIEKSTQQKVKFKVFDESGNILAIILDMEASQVQGLGSTLVRMGFNNPSISKITESRSDEIVQYLIKLCYIHWDRGTEKLVGLVGRDVVEYLNKFRALENPEDIENWKRFCEEHPSKDLQNWYAHKKRYPWLLPGFNPVLSRMPREFWNITPGHSNLVEMAHVSTNRNMDIKLTPLESIQRARIFDGRVAASILAAAETCIYRNINNGEKARMSRNLGRQAHRIQQSTHHMQLNNKIADLKSDLSSSAQKAKEIKAQLKELTEQKKEAGKSPRKNQALRNHFNFPIPKIEGSGMVAMTVDENPSHFESSSSSNTTHEHYLDERNDTNELEVHTHLDAIQSDMFDGEVAAFNADIGIQPNIQPFSFDHSMFPFDPFPFGMDQFNAMLEQGVPKPTTAELDALEFLKKAQGLD